MKARRAGFGIAFLAALACTPTAPTEPTGDYVRISTDQSAYELGQTADVLLENHHFRHAIEFLGCHFVLERQVGEAWERVGEQFCILVPTILGPRQSLEWSWQVQPPRFAGGEHYRYSLDFRTRGTGSPGQVSSNVFTVSE